MRRPCGAWGVLSWSVLYRSSHDDLDVSGDGGEPRLWPEEGAAEGVKDLAHEGCMCSSCFLLPVDRGQNLSQRQRPDWVDREDTAQFHRCGGVRPFVERDDLCLLPGAGVESPRP